MSTEMVNGSGGEHDVTDPERESAIDRMLVENEVTDVDHDAPISDRDGGEDDDEHDLIEALNTPSIDEVKAGLQNLSGGIASAQDVENAARAEEGLPPLEAAGLLDFGPFNPDSALKAIFEKSAEVRQLQSLYDRAKDAAKEAKGELDVAAKALVNIIESLKNRRTQALNPSQPYLADVSAENAKAKGCAWEQTHPGQDCPVCTAARREALQPAIESEVHPEHEGHATVAEAARVQNTLIPLQKQLEAVNVFLRIEELQSVSSEDLAALTAYATEPSVIPPHILAKTCIAAAHGSLAQVCGSCERLLLGVTVAEAESSNTVIGWYPEGARVGLQHAVQTIEGAPAAPPAEQPRKPRSHAKKNAKKKTEPEAERKAQAEEGKRRAPIPKSHSARKSAKKRSK